MAGGPREAELRVVTPTGSLGGGFDADDFRRLVASEPLDVIAVDAGSIDSGPFYLGAGKPFASRIEVKGEIGLMLKAAVEKNIPLVVGNSGYSGARVHVAWMREIVEELARDNRWSFTLATIEAEVDHDLVARKLAAGDIDTFESEVALSPETAGRAARIVAQMGAEPLVEALRQGAQVVLAGRACDDAIIAAYPILKGFDPGLALHMGKILECGSLAAEPISFDAMLATMRADHFDLVPGRLDQACTPQSVSAHCLYERENPIMQQGPGGMIDLSEASYVQVGPRTVRVSGTTYQPSAEYRVKLEGAELAGYRAISINGVRDPGMIRQLDAVLEETKRRTQRYFTEFGYAPDSYMILVHVYGRDAVMKELEPYRKRLNHEYGLILEVIGQTQELANAVCRHYRGRLKHLDFPGQFNTSGNTAPLFSPNTIAMGEVYQFSIYHLMRVDDPLELFPIELSQVGSREAQVLAG